MELALEYTGGGGVGAVSQRIIDIRYPEKIRGEAGETLTIEVITLTEGTGESIQYLQLYIEGQFITEAYVTDEAGNPIPVPPGYRIVWTIEMTLRKDIPSGTRLHFTVAVGHLEDSNKIQDDSRDFTITVEKAAAVSPWVWAAVIGGIIAMAVGIAYYGKR